MSWESFVHQAQPTRVVFGAGTVASVVDEVARLGLRRVLVVGSPGRAGVAERIAGSLGDRAVGVHLQAVRHVPTDVADEAVRVARALDADGCVSVGGGSAVGLAKAVALALDVTIVAVPTTYAGSEMTPVWGLTGEQGKRTGRDARVLPACVVYDPDLTLALPPAVSAASGLNAVAHAVEALYAPDASPVVALLAEEGVRALAHALPDVVASPHDAEARRLALYGAWLCGACLGVTTMGLHHKLCHVLGGRYDLPHAETHATLLPYVAAYNLAAAPAAAAALARALDTADVAGALYDLGGSLGVRRVSLDAVDVDEVVAQLASQPYANPRQVTADGVRRLLDDARAGVRPAA